MAKILYPAPSSSRVIITQRTRPRTLRYSTRYQPARTCWPTTIHFTVHSCPESTRYTSSLDTQLNPAGNDWCVRCTRTQPSSRHTAISYQRNSAGMYLSFFITDFYVGRYTHYLHQVFLILIKVPM